MKKPIFKQVVPLLLAGLIFGNSYAQNETALRERIKLNLNWRFALGHATDASLDYNHGTGYFSYFAKTGYGDGPAAKDFDDRPWRVINIPHDWCVELPFASDGGHSHGYKAIGRHYPENSVGWYRKSFRIEEDDLGKKISIEFDGVHRNSIVWVNGFYLGTVHSGYASFSYDITDYLIYGGENVVAVRVDVTMEEGWYYEGAGIVRHVWLVKTSPLHVARYGTFVTTEVHDQKIQIKSRTTVQNESEEMVHFELSESFLDAEGKEIASGTMTQLNLLPGEEKEYYSKYTLDHPVYWSLENPYLHTLITRIKQNGKTIDKHETTFGIRTVRFDPDEGFFLNDKPVKIVGTNLHQDHAGVGRAIPDALHEFRIKKLKEMGNNGVRTAHDPPTPEFLDACDRLGFLVLDENRLMGINKEHLELLENLMKRDRNHPSVVIWSLGNEEWAIEGNETGTRIASTMQDFANRLDSSRAFTAACSGGWNTGIGRVTQVMGYNYLWHGDIDAHHKQFPWQAGIGTEESNTIGTRGIYVSDHEQSHLAYINDKFENRGAETGWKFYSERAYLSGVFYWTGFDYRGEPTPYAWPAVTSQFGITDLCGFPKDIYYYFKAWWDDEPVVHLYPHWNWPEKKGDTLPVTVYSNCEEIELFLNENSLGKKTMPTNGHLSWTVKYKPGKLEAKGFKDGQVIKSCLVETISPPAKLLLKADRINLTANHEDVSVITVSVNDQEDRIHPTADVDVYFSTEGPGKIIGVGNGNPSSHEAEQFYDEVIAVPIKNLKELPVDKLENRPETVQGYDDSDWEPAFGKKSDRWEDYFDTLIVVRGQFELPELPEGANVRLYSKSIVENQTIYINGKLIASDIFRDDPNQSFLLARETLKEGINEYAVVGQRFRLKHQWDEPNTDPGVIQVVCPAANWKRKTFNGLAQVIVQTTGEAGKIRLKVNSDALEGDEILLISNN